MEQSIFPAARDPFAAPIHPEPEASRDKILRCAARLFRIHGYRATTTRAISEVVGMLSGSLFYHFATKEKILLSIMLEAAAYMCDQADLIAHAPQPPIDRFRRLIAMQLDCLVGEDKQDSFAVLISEWREISELERVPFKALRRRYFQAWQQVLDECSAAGILRADAKATLFALHGAVNWANTWFRSSGDLTVAQFALVLERLAINDAASAPR
jgi:AcrR family transcriptional regulator